jgi:hypothetical protein
MIYQAIPRRSRESILRFVESNDRRGIPEALDIRHIGMKVVTLDPATSLPIFERLNGLRRAYGQEFRTSKYWPELTRRMDHEDSFAVDFVVYGGGRLGKGF